MTLKSKVVGRGNESKYSFILAMLLVILILLSSIFLQTKPGYVILEEKLKETAYVYKRAEIVFIYKGRLIVILPLYCGIEKVETREGYEICYFFAFTSLKYASCDLVGIGFYNLSRHCIRKLPNLKADVTKIPNPWFACKPEYNFPYFQRYWLNYPDNLYWCEINSVPLEEKLYWKYFFTKMVINKPYLFFVDKIIRLNVTIEVYFIFEKVGELKWNEFIRYHVKTYDSNITVYHYDDKLIIDLYSEEYEVYDRLGLEYEFFDY